MMDNVREGCWKAETIIQTEVCIMKNLVSVFSFLRKELSV